MKLFARSAGLVLFLLIGRLVTAAPLIANAQQADLAIPFGAAQGTLFTFGDYLMFVDAQEPARSVAVLRTNISDFSITEGQLGLQLKEPIDDRSGPRSRLVFKLSNPAAAGGFVEWSRMATTAPAASSSPSGTAASSSASPQNQPSLAYDVIHKHFGFGQCRGRLVITPTRVTYESIDNVNHSRQWQMKDVKEVKHSNPYELEIKPFDGNDYKFDLIQKGMPSDEFQMLVKWVTAARTPK